MTQHWQRKTITDEEMRDCRVEHYRRLCPSARHWACRPCPAKYFCEESGEKRKPVLAVRSPQAQKNTLLF